MIAIYTWTGDSFAPLPRFARACDKEFVVHERYQMEAIEERSAVSHRHYFAALHDAWLNLPEGEAEQFPTSEHLRKWALIKSGFADERSVVCGSKAEARRVGSFVRGVDGYAIIIVHDATVKLYTAQSQSLKAMGKVQFQRSKQAVLDLVAGMIGTDTKMLSSQSGVAETTHPERLAEAPMDALGQGPLSGQRKGAQNEPAGAPRRARRLS